MMVFIAIFIIFVLYMTAIEPLWNWCNRYSILKNLKDRTQRIRNHHNFKRICRDDFNNLIFIESALKDFSYTEVIDFIKHKNNPYKKLPQVYFKDIDYKKMQWFEKFSDYWCFNNLKKLIQMEKLLDDALTKKLAIYNKTNGKICGFARIKSRVTTVN